MPIYKTKNKKDGKQQYRVCVNYTNANGDYKQLSRLVYGAAEAKFKELELEQQIKSNNYTDNITVKELYEHYITSKKSEVRTTTLEKSKSILNFAVLPYFDKVRLSDLSAQKLQKWKNDISEKEVATITKKNYYKEFSAMLNYAVKIDYLPRNPLAKLGNFKDACFEVSADKLHYYTAEQFKKYISVALEHCKTLDDWGYYIFFNIAFYTGMRKGEINALRWSDIEDNIIHVRRSVSQKVKGETVVETPPKNKSSYRDLQMPKQLIKLLAEQKDRQKQEKVFTEEWRVCGGYKCLCDTGISNHNILFAKEAELPTIRIHDFRHTHATLLINEGIIIQEIARRLGHSKIEMTWNVYGHLYPREEERALKVLEKI